ncbi:MAG: ABC transporter permease subunit [Xanthomonadales bacterium]|nr:ABC transporter permease subunit [Xanthomonadales bacterium]
MNTIEIIIKYREDFLIGLSVTIQMTIIIWIVGVTIGSILGILGTKYSRSIGLLSKIVSFLLGGIPVLVFLYWLHYPFQNILNIQIDGFYTTILTLSILNIFLVAEQVRNAVEQFPRDYIDSAEVCGFNSNEIIRKIQFPYILRQILPAIIFIQVVMMHSTLFASLISVDELFRIASRVNSEIYKPVEVYSTLAIFFLLITLPITGFAYWLRKRYAFIK